MNGEKKNDGIQRVYHQISYHPEYLKEFLKTENFLLRGDGPLRYDHRHYIAIMAAARHQCTCLISHHKQKFTAQGGNPQWLQGLQHIPAKLRNLSEINKIMAHTPWLLRRSHIERLTKGKEAWSLGELCQALVLLAHFHSLCSFVFASEILETPEEGSETGHLLVDDYINCEEDAVLTVEELMEKMQIIQNKEKECSCEEAKSDSASSADSKHNCDIHRFTDDHSFPGNDCLIAQDRPNFFIQDCSWDGHAYSLLNCYYSDVGTILDEKFKVAYDLTYYTQNHVPKSWHSLVHNEKLTILKQMRVETTCDNPNCELVHQGLLHPESSMGHKENVDTTIFRRAVWNYIHRMYSIMHDDYNYSEMENLLEKGFRSYAETVCFCPEKITHDAHDEIMRAFRHSEKVHVNLMLFEARLQGELLYAFAALMQYMSDKEN